MSGGIVITNLICKCKQGKTKANAQGLHVVAALSFSGGSIGGDGGDRPPTELNVFHSGVLAKA